MSSVRVQARLEQRGVDFDLALDDGEVLAVLGPNGAGKSTLLQLIAGLLRPDDGRIELGGDRSSPTPAQASSCPRTHAVSRCCPSRHCCSRT